MMLMVVALFAACSEDEGTDVGSDGTPKVTIYQYEAVAPNNSDTDVNIRFAVNNKVESLYYLAETAADKKARVEEIGETGYNNYVVEHGTKVNIPEGELFADMVITGLIGEYAITAVAVRGNVKTAATVAFTGIEWLHVKGATANMNVFTGEEIETELLYDAANDRYRIADPWGTGASIIFKWDGASPGVTFLTSTIATGWMHPSYGEVSFKPSSANSAYYPAYDAFVFSGEWTVSAGSFGDASGEIYLHD